MLKYIVVVECMCKEKNAKLSLINIENLHFLLFKVLIKSSFGENFLVQIEFAMLLHADYLQIWGLILAH